MTSEGEQYRLIMEHIAPLFALRADIEMAAMLRPSAIILPLSLFPQLDTIKGMPIIRGDRTALVYEPVKR